MEEELNENELEERFYSMLYYEDYTPDSTVASQDVSSIIENAPRSTVRRYWRTSGDHSAHKENNPYRKINTPKETSTIKNNNNNNTPTLKENNTENAKPKEEKSNSPGKSLPLHLAIFQSPVPPGIKKTIEIIENDDKDQVLELESSDEDEVVEVALPPKPTITIESSDEEDSTQSETPPKGEGPLSVQEKHTNPDREICTSPVPSVVSSVSDEFIRGDCIALNISSKRPDNHSFDFSLHGAEFHNQSTRSKRRKKKKNKESAPTTPVIVEASKPPNSEGYFATPKSKAKRKRQRKSYAVTEKSVPNADVYDSDSNQSYTVTDKSLPSTDVYESDSSETVHPTLEIIKVNHNQRNNIIDLDRSGSNGCIDNRNTTNAKHKNSNHEIPETTVTIVDLTDNDNLKEDNINENIVIGNVTGFPESDDYGELTKSPRNMPQDVTKYESTKIPAILYEDLDFDNLKGKDKVCRNRRYSLTSLRAEMEKFYNESWGGENFNHREIQKNMSRDKSLWAIDPKDRISGFCRKKNGVTCNYCNRPGHRGDTCRQRPVVCYMCGNAGHVEPRCPSKICVNCGSPNHMYSTLCRNCAGWARLACGECGQRGHPSSHCPDMWRRYHNTIDSSTALEENHYLKKHYQLFCSGCTRRGHLVHTCRISFPFSGLPINSPYVHQYRPVYGPIMESDNEQNQKNIQQYNRSFQQDSTISSATNKNIERNKRQSKSPTTHESHVNKRKMIASDIPDVQRNSKSPLSTAHQRKNSQSKDVNEGDKAKDTENVTSANIPEKGAEVEKALDFIPIGSSNRDKKGQMIQYNEVSDTSDVVISARIYITTDIADKLKTDEGQEWLKQTTEKVNVTVENADIHYFLSIKGKMADQEAFQTLLREWSKKITDNPDSPNESVQNNAQNQFSALHNISKYRNNVLRQLSKALDSLKVDLGDPTQMYKELNYLQNRHAELMRQKVINPKQLTNNRDNINQMLKKLNMILLGQAGLANGWKHLNELYTLQEKLINHRQKTIPPQLRHKIGEHYHCIFTAMPRTDYGELLEKYQLVSNNRSTIVFKKKKDKSFKINPKKKKKFQVVTTQQTKNLAKETVEPPKKEVVAHVESKNPQARQCFVQKTMKNLVFYHKRLMKVHPNDSVLKKTRMNLVRKLHSHIASLRLATTSSKTLKKLNKKMKKVQEQAQVFLNNV